VSSVKMRPRWPGQDGGSRPERTAARENAAVPPSLAGRAEARGVARVRSWALGLPRHGGRRWRRPPHVRHPHIVLSFDRFEQREASARLVSTSLQMVAGGIPRDVTVTVRTPEGDPGAVLTGVSGADGDVLVVGRGNAASTRRLLHGSVSSRENTVPEETP
jgi:nucleotide-binding universal stress UspA family protein